VGEAKTQLRYRALTAAGGSGFLNLSQSGDRPEWLFRWVSWPDASS
jgi:hypothetical protein